MKWPLKKIFHGYTSDSQSFQNIDIATHMEVPVGEHVGAFGVKRKFDMHQGIDLYAISGDEVHSMEDGVVVNKGWFTGEHAGSDWWHNTHYIMIESHEGVICYGEIKCVEEIKIGDKLPAGTLLGHIAPVLKKDKGRPMAMLHLELYKHGTKEPVEWSLNQPQPDNLLNAATLFTNRI